MAVAEYLVDAELAVSGVDGALDFGGCKNEAIVGGVFKHHHDVDEVVQVLLFLLEARFLEVAELGDDALKLAA